MADGDLTVVLSSHLVADLERVCDHLILLTASRVQLCVPGPAMRPGSSYASRVQLCGDIDALLAEHKVLVGPRKDTSAIERTHKVVHTVQTARQATLLVQLGGAVIDPACQAEDVSLEDLVLAYMGTEAAPAYARLTTVGEDQ